MIRRWHFVEKTMW